MYKVCVRSRYSVCEPGNVDVGYTVLLWVTGTYVVAIVGAIVEVAAIVTGSMLARFRCSREVPRRQIRCIVDYWSFSWQCADCCIRIHRNRW